MKASPKGSEHEVSVVFDVSSLMGKTIDEVRGVLGNPPSQQLEPTDVQLQFLEDEWSNYFDRDGQDLSVTFSPKTRRVKDFFLTGDDREVLMKRGNLTDKNPGYRIEAIKSNRNPSEITGIQITPVRPAGTYK